MQLAMISRGRMGAGHFVKIVHNGIEYGLMVADAEGLDILRNANVGKREHAVDAETTPLRQPDFASQVLSAMRHGFGGHVEKKAGGEA